MESKQPKPETRTEDDKVVQEGLKVILGGKEYKIAPLVIRDSREWRQKAAPFQAMLARYAAVDSNNPEEFEKVLTEIMGSRIDETINLFFEYAKELNREGIESIATDREIVTAFNEVVKVAFPFGE